MEIGSAIIARASRRMEIAAENIANVTTPGFQARRSYAAMLLPDPARSQDGAAGAAGSDMSVDFTAGKMIKTDNALDFAAESGGYFMVRKDDDIVYTRDGQFHRDGDGRLVTASALVLQSDAGDIRVGGGKLSVLRDGTILEDGQPVARIPLFAPAQDRDLRLSETGLFSAAAGEMQPVSNPQIRQGMLQASNVSTADEMLSLMAALRSAEAGQRVVQVYDDLMGRALTAFGQT